MKIAVFGCLHGELNQMYSEVEKHERENNIEIDLVIVCGDCQTVRHEDDLQCMSIKPKYRRLGDFHEYYSGAKKIPRLTIFVGGNHEASNYLITLPYGGWVCDNFYYLGYAGVIRYRGLRIAGVSGIYNYHNCNKGRFERLPLNESTTTSVYHTRRLDIFRLQLLTTNADKKNPINVFISHDWPNQVYLDGDYKQLLQFKPAFRRDVERKSLGSPLTQPLINQLKPERWFAAHLHCKFYAKIKHDQNRFTEFLSLNKIENRRNYMDTLELNANHRHDDSDNDLYYDEEWLTILRKTINLEVDSMNNVYCPRIDDDSGKAYMPTEKDIQETIDLMNKSGGLKIPRNFRMSEPVIYSRPDGGRPSLDPRRIENFPNPQNIELCTRLQLKVPREVDARKEREKTSSPVDLDEEGCLPFYIDTKGDR